MITENTEDNLPKTDVEHYYATEDEKTEQCISDKIDAGLSYEEAVEACKDHEKQPAPASDMVEAEDIYYGLNMCVDMRCLGGESKEVARGYCLRMFKDDPNIKAAFDDDADPQIIARLVLDWEHLHHPSQKWWREDRDIKKYQREKAVEKKMGEIARKRGRINYPLESDLRRAAEQQLDIETYTRKHDYSDRATVGSTFGKTKAQIIAEDSDQKQKGRTTVGGLYGLSRAEILADSQSEPSPMDKCVKNRMDVHGDGYKMALAWCKIELEVE